MAVSKCVTHDLPITDDGCPECSRLVDEAIASAPRHRTIPVGPAAQAEVERLRDENRQLRIERDNAREMEDVHGDNWEAATAEVERLRGLVNAVVGVVCPWCKWNIYGDGPHAPDCEAASLMGWERSER
jgi:hypothetical protein